MVGPALSDTRILNDIPRHQIIPPRTPVRWLRRLPQHSGDQGDLTVFEHILPGILKQVFYITNAHGSTRGGHRHQKGWQALVCVQGNVDILVESG
jgi:hypothetical protein